MLIFINNVLRLFRSGCTRKINRFYEISRQLHISLDEVTVQRKMQRIYDGLDKLGKYALTYRKARLLPEWIESGYRECIIEDFHFAFQIYRDDNDLLYVYVHDVCHSLLYHE